MSPPPDTPLCNPVGPTKQRAKRHYGSHPYFTKRAWNVVQAYIRHFSSQGDTVLDAFGGSGVTAVESLVLGRKAIYVDISEWACFLARQTAIAPVDLARLFEAFEAVERACRRDVEGIWAKSNKELAQEAIADWYPRGVPLPSNADVQYVEDLFTPRMLHGLSRLRASIMDTPDTVSRDLLLLAFSSTLARVNRTFLSTRTRRESRGGPAIFSLYRYKVAKRPVELPLWEQFGRRVARVLEAKRETNRLIGDFYQDGTTAVFRHGSATRLDEWIEPESVDYVYTDPPYGGHIAYLDLSTMWAAWLGFDINARDRAEEIIEGGELRKSRDDYHHLMMVSLEQIARVVKKNAWLSIVFVHRDTEYWERLVDACRQAGFRYVNTVVQPVGVVWSMHKKKNPLRVLSGELVLNLRKSSSRVRRRRPTHQRVAEDVVRERCEREIVENAGATTEALHHAVIPQLLEAGLLADFSRQWGDLTPFLDRFFDSQKSTGQWHLRWSEERVADFSSDALLAYCIKQFLHLCESAGRLPDEAEVRECVRSCLGTNISEACLRGALEGVAYSPDGAHWQEIRADVQQAFQFSDSD